MSSWSSATIGTSNPWTRTSSYGWTQPQSVYAPTTQPAGQPTPGTFSFGTPVGQPQSYWPSFNTPSWSPVQPTGTSQPNVTVSAAPTPTRLYTSTPTINGIPDNSTFFPDGNAGAVGSQPPSAVPNPPLVPQTLEFWPVYQTGMGYQEIADDPIEWLNAIGQQKNDIVAGIPQAEVIDLSPQSGGGFWSSVGGIAGGAIGAYFGGPIGAQIGSQLGSQLGSQFDS